MTTIGEKIEEAELGFSRYVEYTLELEGKVRKLEEENRKLKAHCNMLESENRLLKEECKARLEKIKELEK